MLHICNMDINAICSRPIRRTELVLVSIERGTCEEEKKNKTKKKSWIEREIWGFEVDADDQVTAER